MHAHPVADLLIGALGARLVPRPTRGLKLEHYKINISFYTCGPQIFTPLLD